MGVQGDEGGEDAERMEYDCMEEMMSMELVEGDETFMEIQVRPSVLSEQMTLI